MVIWTNKVSSWLPGVLSIILSQTRKMLLRWKNSSASSTLNRGSKISKMIVTQEMIPHLRRRKRKRRRPKSAESHQVVNQAALKLRKSRRNQKRPLWWLHLVVLVVALKRQQPILPLLLKVSLLVSKYQCQNLLLFPKHNHSSSSKLLIPQLQWTAYLILEHLLLHHNKLLKLLYKAKVLMTILGLLDGKMLLSPSNHSNNNSSKLMIGVPSPLLYSRHLSSLNNSSNRSLFSSKPSRRTTCCQIWILCTHSHSHRCRQLCL